jgi:hypothetical protein
MAKLETIIRKMVLKIIPHKAVRLIKKVMTPDYIFFGAAKKDIGKYIIEEKGIACSLYGMERKLGAQVSEGFVKCYDDYAAHPDFLRKYILEVEDCIIEPKFGWAISAVNDKLVFDSISNNSWIESYYPDHSKYKLEKTKAVPLEVAISINMLKGGENNYWHFLHDLMGEVALALKDLPQGIPFLVSRNLYEKKYFQNALLISPRLAAQQWIVRDETTYYRIAKAWFIQTMPNSNEQFFAVRELLNVPDSDPQSNRKVFLTRSQQRIRHLKNNAVIEKIAQQYGFEIIDTDSFSLQQQIKLFGETNYLIGIHGAGLTNQLFRKDAPMLLLELLPADYLQPHYFWLNKGMGHQYDCLVGTASALDTSFEIDAEAFEIKIKSWLGL